MYVRQLCERVLIEAPAKVNLSLEVLFNRSDGFHEIETLIVAVRVCDTLEFTPTADGEIRLECRWASGMVADKRAELGDLPQGPENIVWRAASLVRERAGVTSGAQIRLIKRIPSAAGLGGASADAAAAIVAANLAWKLAWPRERLAALAAEIGSDVPFFLGPGAAICRGRGEQIESIPACRLHLVVVRPPVGLSTPAVYKACHPAPPRDCQHLRGALARGNVAAASRMLNNRLEDAAQKLTPWISHLRGEFSRQGMLGHQMSGSGSGYFGICWHARQARRVAARLRSRRPGWVRAAVTTNH
ncbi:MAG: 4-(cytidine 5'-diphospho)-2-C-methyl-D-erythritol kinase [Planctomycetaceae bacterium]|nr:4-(cytidine 5'-diphospho)-2-C-methyl-D-erythritol kinase [Planctomycetaceae bacterium]